MRIAIITPSFPSEPIDGMFLTMSLEIAGGLKAQGHDLLIISLSDKEGEEIVAGMRVYRVRPDFDRYNGLSAIPQLNLVSYWLHCSLLLFTKARALIDEFSPDVIEVQDFSALALPWLNYGKYPVVLRAIGSLSEMIRNGSVNAPPMALHLAWALELSTMTGSAMVLSLCQDLLNKVSAYTRLPPGQARIIRTPLSIPDLPEREPAALSNYPQIMFWGRVDAQKGCDLLIDALPRLSEQFPDFKLTVAGRQVDQAYLSQLIKQVRDKNLSDRVIFTGELPRDELIRRAVNSDICVFPSRYETACYACLEAMSYGCCVVAPSVGGLGEYVQHGITGWLVSPESADEIAEALIHLSRNPDLRQQLSREAQRMISDLCNPARSIALTENAYRQAISGFSRCAHPENVLPVINVLLQALADSSLLSWIKDLQIKTANTAYAEAYAAGLKAGREAAMKDLEESKAGSVNRIYSLDQGTLK